MEYKLNEKNKPKFKIGSRQAWEDKVSSLSFNLSRKTKNITSELKTNTKLDKSMKHKNGRRDELTDTQRFNMEEGPGFNPWVGKIPWRREWLPTPVFWPREVHELYGIAIDSMWSQ